MEQNIFHLVLSGESFQHTGVNSIFLQPFHIERILVQLLQIGAEEVLEGLVQGPVVIEDDAGGAKGETDVCVFYHRGRERGLESRGWKGDMRVSYHLRVASCHCVFEPC